MALNVTNDGIAILTFDYQDTTQEQLEDLWKKLDHINKRGDIKALLISAGHVLDPSPSQYLELIKDPEQFRLWQEHQTKLLETFDRFSLPIYAAFQKICSAVVLPALLFAEKIFVCEEDFISLFNVHEGLLFPYPVLPLLWDRAGWTATRELVFESSPHRIIRRLPVKIIPKLIINRYPIDYIRNQIKTSHGKRTFNLSLPGKLNIWLQTLKRHIGRRALESRSNGKDYLEWHSRWCSGTFSTAEYLDGVRESWCSDVTRNALQHLFSTEIIERAYQVPKNFSRVLSLNTLPSSNELLHRMSQKGIRIRIVEQNLDNLSQYLTHHSGDASTITPSNLPAGVTRSDWIIMGEKEEHLLETLTDQFQISQPITVLNAVQASSHYQKLSRHPGLTLGIHLIENVAEIVPASRTRKSTKEWVKNALQFLEFVPLIVNDSPGGFCYRIMAQLLNEALLLVEEGIGIEQLDSIFTGFGILNPPFRLADRLGNDVLVAAAEEVNRYKPYILTLSDIFHIIVEHGHLGVKILNGFYLYKNGIITGENRKIYKYFGKQRKRMSHVHGEEIIERLLFSMVQDVLHCLSEDVVSDLRTVDVVLGLLLKFPGRLGGPLRYCEQLGWPYIESRLRQWSQTYGPRYAPSGPLLHMIENRKSIFEV